MLSVVTEIFLINEFDMFLFLVTYMAFFIFLLDYTDLGPVKALNTEGKYSNKIGKV